MTLEAAPDRNLGHADRKLSTQQSLFIPTFFFFFKKTGPEQPSAGLKLLALPQPHWCRDYRRTPHCQAGPNLLTVQMNEVFPLLFHLLCYWSPDPGRMDGVCSSWWLSLCAFLRIFSFCCLCTCHQGASLSFSVTTLAPFSRLAAGCSRRKALKVVSTATAL